MKFVNIVIAFAFFVLQGQAQDKKEIIDVSGFDNSAHHWYDISAEDNIIEPIENQPRYKPWQIKEIADNILLYQKENGGWAKNYDMLAILTEEQKEALLKSKDMTNTTFDNWTTHTQVEYLARAYEILKDERYKVACLKGIEFILSAQYSNGGWPQFYPDTSGYRKYITFNDGAMAGIMRVLYNIVKKVPHYSFVEKDLYERSKVAFEKGLRCILDCQIKENGKLYAWGQQHDNVTLKPQKARTYELPSIANQESADLVLFLMDIDDPSPELINAIESAVSWFEESKIKGIRIEEKKIEPKKYKWSTLSIDRIVVEDSTAPPIWPRYSELVTHKPLFSNRDGKKVYSLAEVAHERRAGYSWYTYLPQRVLDKYPEWKKKLVKE
ncbi:pectate lyase [Melioribacter sp. OK-6-Me]|uniref:pectate lyase n=1 Tax=unclassified Melioribacter TaxID=2627329 RepID=UPI003EDB65E8